MLHRVLALGLFLLLSAPTGAEPPLRLRITPKVALEPADIEIRASFARNPDNRLISVIAESDDFYRRSEIHVRGSSAPQTFVIRYRALPRGVYQVTAILEDVNGHTRQVSEQLRVKP